MIDLRSDTVTKPTKEMREAMYNAVVGDDVYGDDPTVNELESYAAELVGKEAAIFVPSGTFGNQVSLLTHCNRGDEVILGDDCHIVQHEVGASSVIAGVQLRTLKSDRGILDVAEIKSKIREEDIHFPKTGLICVENAHSNGRVIPVDVLKNIYAVAQENNIPVHLDGARLFNAACTLKTEAKEIAKHCDSVMFCLSKGLCAPVGSIVAGSRDFIDKARKNRKLMGGGLRQSGILAAAGLVALREMTKRLHVDHDNAKLLGEKLNELDNVNVFLEDTHISMVFFEITKDIDYRHLVDYYNDNGIKVNGPENGVMRFVTNNDVKEEDIDYIVECTDKYLNR
ncbi:threonine aldolase [Vallitalea longa]|uniref:Threonine aldolase n=1 Tax=Vallitalea longa TaxID=2936439 RepID=A0A9W5YC26_9FIRM|nr:low-specificity L-threonine aldolase [Vallitalea longa]GKX30732.1 threonine aldolase [Vallitalea longa]